MRTSAKFFIDRVFAMPLAWTANLATRAAAPIARRDHRIDADAIRTIAVAKLLGMGSIIQATPLLHDLHRTFPHAKIVFITTRANRELIERLEVIDDAVYVDDRSPRSLARTTSEAILELLRRRIDLYFDLEVYSAGASILSVASGARNRCGFYRSSARFKKGLFTHLTVFNPRVPIAAIYRQLHVAVGGKKIGEPAFGPIVVRGEDVTSLETALERNGVTLAERYVVVNANASDLLLERRWPTHRYVALIEKLTARGTRVVLVGAPSEAAYVAEIVARLSDAARARVDDTSGKLKLGELFALIRGAACVVTNDTGPMHFSIALDRPTVCLFGPVSPDHYGVHKSNVEMLYHAVYCSPCAHELDEPPCAGNNVCMQLIEVDEVLAAVDASARECRERAATVKLADRLQQRREGSRSDRAIERARRRDERARASASPRDRQELTRENRKRSRLKRVRHRASGDARDATDERMRVHVELMADVFHVESFVERTKRDVLEPDVAEESREIALGENNRDAPSCSASSPTT